MWSDMMEKESMSRDEQDALLLDVYKQLFTVAYSIMRDKCDAMDVVQESWVKILRKLHTLRDRDKLIPWVKVIAANTAYNMVKRKVTVSLCHAAVDSCPFPLQDGVEERVIRSISLEEIRKLDEKTKRIFIYKYFYDMKDKEIAERMKLPIGTVKARIHRGKAYLRNVLLDSSLRVHKSCASNK